MRTQPVRVSIRTQAALSALTVLVSGVAGASTTPGATNINYYVSPIDGSSQPYSVYVPNGYDPAVKHPVVIDLHGFGGRFKTSRTVTEKSWADPRGWLLVSVDGRGVLGYDHIGDFDVFRVLDAVKALFNVDEDRIYLTGFSMGGHGTYRLGLRYPDVFAAIAPGAGWTDYREFYDHWYDPGNAPMMPAYIDPSRIPGCETASSLWQAENGEHLWMRIAYATDDTINPPINHLNMIAALNSFGYTRHTVAEFSPQPPLFIPIGHSGSTINATNDVYGFLDGKVRTVDPAHVVYTTNRLRYNKTWWVQIDGVNEWNQWGRIEGTVTGQTIDVQTSKLSAFRLTLNGTLVNTGLDIDVVVNGTSVYQGPYQASHMLEAVYDGNGAFSSWGPPVPPTGHVKRAGLEGPISDAMMGPFVVIYGTQGSAQQTARNLEEAQLFAVQWNGRLILRWGEYLVPSVPDQNDWFIPNNPTSPFYPWVPAAYMSDAVLVTPVSDTVAQGMSLTGKNLILFGGPESNSFSATVAPTLPITLGDSFVTVNGRTYTGSTVNYSVIYPNAAGSNYVVVNKGFLWMGRTGTVDNWFNGKDVEGLQFYWPDYIVWDSSLAREGMVTAGSTHRYLPAQYLEAGHFDANWQIDTTPPVTSAALTGTPGPKAGSLLPGAQVALASNDNPGGFGVDTVEYSIDGAAWQPYTGPVVFNTPGTFLMEYRASDRPSQHTYGPVGGSGPIRAVQSIGNTENPRSALVFISGPASPLVIVTESGGSTEVTEGGPGDDYTVVLTSAPADPVTIAITDTNGQLTGIPPLVFTTADWSTPKIVTVTANDDIALEGDHQTVIEHLVSSADGAFDGIMVRDITVPITDNDGCGPLNPGDLNRDSFVSLLDLNLVLSHFGQSNGDAGWDPAADANCDDVVNIIDLNQVLATFGTTY